MTDTASPYRAQSRATVALARFGPGGLWGSGESLGWIAVGVNLVLGVAWIAAFEVAAALPLVAAAAFLVAFVVGRIRYR